MSVDVPQTSYFPAVIKCPSDYEVLTSSSLANGPVSDLASRTLFLLNQHSLSAYKRQRYNVWSYSGSVVTGAKSFKDTWTLTLSEPLGLNTDYIRVSGILNYMIGVSLTVAHPDRVVVSSSFSISTGGSTSIDSLTATTQYDTDGDQQSSALLSQYVQGGRHIDVYLQGQPNNAVLTLSQVYSYPDRRWAANVFSQNNGQGVYIASQPSVMVEVFRN